MPLNEEKWIINGSNEFIADFLSQGVLLLDSTQPRCCRNPKQICLVLDETSKQQERVSRLWILDQSEAMSGQGGGAGCEEHLYNR